MSTALAIASVTHVLKDLLNNGLIDQNVSGATGGNVIVTALPPDRIDVSPAGQSQLNLFMYRVSANTGWCNMEQPSRNSRGDRTGNPPLALDLHYLLTAYGANELHSEILLGYGMQLFHEHPVLDRKAIKLSLLPVSAGSGGGLPDNLRALSLSGLADQAEQIKIAPENINIEEISKLWAAFQAKYRPTAGYMVSVVLIESEQPSKPSLPVDKRNIYAFPLNQILIEKILSRIDQNSQAEQNQKIIPGYQVVIRGNNLYSSHAEVVVNNKSIQDLDSIDYKEIVFTVPDNLHAGIQALQVVHKQMIGQPPRPFVVSESNVIPFILCPDILSASVSDLHINGNNTRSADIQINVNPPVDINQRIVLLLNEYDPLGGPDELHAYSFVAPAQPVPSPPGLISTITIPVKDVIGGIYIVRIRVNGAESPLHERDPDGYYYRPNITI